MTKEQELAKLKKNSPYELPDNPAESGWSTQQIKEKFYAGLLVLYEFLEVERGRITQIDYVKLVAIQNSITAILNGTSVVGKANADSDGNTFATMYAKIVNITNGNIAALKYLKGNGTSENINKIESDLTAFQLAYSRFIATNFTEGKAKNAINAENATKALGDSLGRVIKDTYATVASLNLTNSEITNIKNGTTIVNKAYKDQNGDMIDTTYVKKSQIVDNLTSTSTEQPLSANQGRALKALIDNLMTVYLNSTDSDLDQMAEIVAYIKNNKSLIQGITTAKMGFTDLVTNYTSNLSNKPLAANVAVLLKSLIDAKLSPSDVINSLDSALENKPLSAKQGAVLLSYINLKANSADVDTSAQVTAKIQAAIAGVNTMNVIADEDNDKNYDFQLKVKNGKPVLILDEII